MARAFGDFNLHARAEELSVAVVEAEFAQDNWKFRFKFLRVGKARFHGRIHFACGLCFENIFEVDVEGLERAAEFVLEKRGEVAAHGRLEQRHHERFDFALRHFAFEGKLARDGRRFVWIERIDFAGHAEICDPFFVAHEAEEFASVTVGNRVALRIPVALLTAVHHARRNRAVNVARHHPRQRALLCESVGVAVTSLDFLAHKPMRDEFAISVKPALAVGVCE